MDSKTLYTEVGRRAAARRHVLGRTQVEVAEKMGLSRASLANIEVGRQSLLLHQVYALAAALDLQSLDDLLPVLPGGSSRPTKIGTTGSNLNKKQLSEVDAFIAAVEKKTTRRGK